MSRVYEVRDTSIATPGDIANLGAGDRVHVWRSALLRTDWAAMARAVMTAYYRGAQVVLETVETN